MMDGQGITVTPGVASAILAATLAAPVHSTPIAHSVSPTLSKIKVLVNVFRAGTILRIALSTMSCVLELVTAVMDLNLQSAMNAQSMQIEMSIQAYVYARQTGVEIAVLSSSRTSAM